jgi:NHL repeat-containing protein
VLAVLAAAVAFLGIGASAAKAEKSPIFWWGSQGTGAGQFSFAQGIGVNGTGAGAAEAGDVYVANTALHRIDQFDAAGNFIRAFGFDVVLRGEHNSAANEKVTMTVRAGAGYYRLRFTNLNTPSGPVEDRTPPIPYNAPASEVEAAINRMASINGVDGEVSVTGGPGDSTGSTPYVITFEGGVGGTDVTNILRLNGSVPAPLSGGVPSSTILFSYANGGAFEKCEADSDPKDICKQGPENVGTGGAMGAPTSVDVDQATGDLFVVDQNYERVQKFDADGDFLLTFGKDVIRSGQPGDTGEGFEVCTVAAECQAGQVGSLGGELSLAGQQPRLAVVPAGAPNAGNVVVADPGNSRVQEFTSSGDFVRTFGFDVAASGADDTGTGFEACTQAGSGAANCKAGTPGAEVGQFEELGPSRVAVDSTGAIYTVESNSNHRVQKFTGPVLTPTVFAPGDLSGSDESNTPTDVKVGPGDEVYVVKATPAEATPACPDGEPSKAERRILELSSAGVLQETHMSCGSMSSISGLGVNPTTGRLYFTSIGNAIEGARHRVYAVEETTAPAATIESPSDISGYGATFNGTVDPNGSYANYRFEYSTDGANWTPLGNKFAGSGDSPVAASQTTGTLQPGTSYEVRLVASKPFGGPQQVTGTVSFTTPMPAPSVSKETVVAGAARVTLAGSVNPNGSTTEYHFEYGLGDCASNPCTSTPVQSAGAGTEGAYVSAEVTGLSPNTLYHYRLVASNGSGTTNGPDLTFRTSAPLVNQLPDGRVYEQVSPVNKSNSDVYHAQSVAAVDGNRFIFTSPGSFAGSQTSQALNSYLAVRGPNGWTTEGIMMPGGRLHFQNGYRAFSENLDKGVIRWAEDSLASEPYDPEAPFGMNYYMRDNVTGEYQLLSGTFDSPGAQGGVAGGNADFSQVVFETNVGLTPEAMCGEGAFVQEVCAYENDEGTVRPVTVLPSGRLTKGTIGGGLGTANTDRAISLDGNRVFFSAMEDGGSIYARTGGETTVEVSASERSTSGPTGQQFWYQGAEAAHGDRVIFTTKNALVDEDRDTTNDLYLYDFTAAAGDRLTLISEDRNAEGPIGANVEENNQGGVFAKSEDLRRVYFVTQNQIVEGAPSTPGPKLYLWDDSDGTPQVTYIATLDQADETAWKGPSVDSSHPTGMKPARPSTDGRYVAFLSVAKLTAHDNEGQNEVYVYDAADGSIVCASCSPDAQLPGGRLEFDENLDGPPDNHLTENVSDNGQVFFETERGLVPRDSNGAMDVYEWDDGQLHLISAGTGQNNSRFLDATPDGSSVFFTTRDQLVGWDKDTALDAYVARIGGGLPEPPPAPPACEGEACQPPPIVPNDPTPSSANYVGPGDPVPGAKKGKKKCKKGKVRRKGRCVKKKPRAGKKKQGSQKTTTRKHG